MADVNAFALGEALFGECQLVHDFLEEKVQPRVREVAGRSPGVETDTYHGLMIRVLAWMGSIGKLNHPGDFQAITVASRTLCETAVDVTLLHFDPTNYPIAKLIAWEESAKLKSAIKIRDYFAKKGKVPPQEYAPQIKFITTEQKRIEGLRATHWPGKKGQGHHPSNRWTERTLDEDAAVATKLFPEGEFEEFCATRYQQLCWNTHGSGLAGVRSISADNLPGLGALAMKECTHFALLIAEVTLRHFRLWDAALLVEFDDHGRARAVVKHQALNKHR